MSISLEGPAPQISISGGTAYPDGELGEARQEGCEVLRARPVLVLGEDYSRQGVTIHPKLWKTHTNSETQGH